MKLNRIAAFCLTAVCLAPAPSFASLIGDNVQAVWTFGGYVDNNSFVASDGVDLVGGWGVSHNLDIRDSSIVVDFPSAGGLSTGVNWLFADLDWIGTPSVIASVSVNTNYSGWSNSFLSFGDDFVNVNFASDVSFLPRADQFEILINWRPTSVPEPGALMLFGLGLVGLNLSRRRRTANRAA